MRSCILSFLLAGSAAVAQSTLTGPSLGLVYDSTAQGIRPILGIPGASTAGPQIKTGFTISNAAIAATQDYALAISTHGSLNLVTFASDGVTAKELNTASSANVAPDRIIMSPTGSAAILYFKSKMALQIVSGMPGSTRVGAQVDISALPQAPDAFGISDDASVVLAGVPGSGGVFVIPTDGSSARVIARAQHASALTFLPRSHDVLIADDAANTITRISDAGGQSAAVWSFSDAGLIAPDSVQASGDQKTILAASSKSSVLAIIDPSGGNAPTYFACQCTPAEVRPFRPAGIYQITEPRNGLLWIFDSNVQNPRVLFVPVPVERDVRGAGTHGR